MSEKYIEVRLVEAEPAVKVDGKVWVRSAPVPPGHCVQDGYLVKLPSREVRWEKADDFLRRHVFVDSDDIQEKNSNGTCQGAENEFIAETNNWRAGDRTLVVWARLQNGEELVETYTCTTPADYDERTSFDICMGRIKNRVEKYLGSLLRLATAAQDSAGNAGAGAPETGEHQPTEHLTFGQALEAAKRGEKIQREGWNGKGQFVYLANCISYRAPSGRVFNAEHQNIGSCALAFVGTSGVQMGWLASQADMLASDWRVVQ